MAVKSLALIAAAELRKFVEVECSEFAAQHWLLRALDSRGKLLSGRPEIAWGVLPILVCDAVGGDPLCAIPISMATECFISAADVFDDIEDADASDSLWRACGIATAVNVATLLLLLTNRSEERRGG